MPSLILHIGWHKTGSSVLQAFLRDVDLSDHGITYLRKGPHKLAYNTVQYTIASADRMAQDQARLQRQVAQTKTDRVVISAEVMSTLPPAPVAKWINAVDWDDIQIVAYVRRQDEYLESLYKQAVKWGHMKQRISAFLTSGGARHTQYLRTLQNWQRAFPQAKLTPRVFHRDVLAQGDIRADFLAAIGLAGAVETFPAHPGNISPSAGLIELYRQLDIDNLQRVNRKVLEAPLAGLTGHHDLLTPDHRASLLEKHAAQNEQLRAAYFPDAEALFPPVSPPQNAPFDRGATIEVLLSAIKDIIGPDAAKAAETSLKGPRP